MFWWQWVIIAETVENTTLWWVGCGWCSPGAGPGVIYILFLVGPLGARRIATSWVFYSGVAARAHTSFGHLVPVSGQSSRPRVHTSFAFKAFGPLLGCLSVLMYNTYHYWYCIIHLFVPLASFLSPNCTFHWPFVYVHLVLPNQGLRVCWVCRWIVDTWRSPGLTIGFNELSFNVLLLFLQAPSLADAGSEASISHPGSFSLPPPSPFSSFFPSLSVYFTL